MHIVRRDHVNRARNADHAVRTCERFVYSTVKITRSYDYQTWADTFFWEIHEVRKGMWAFCFYCLIVLFSCWLAGQTNLMEDKMVAEAFERVKNYGWDGPSPLTESAYVFWFPTGQQNSSEGLWRFDVVCFTAWRPCSHSDYPVHSFLWSYGEKLWWKCKEIGVLMCWLLRVLTLNF